MENPNYPTDRISASKKRDNDLTPSQFPVITKSAYVECVQKPASMVDMKKRSLCLARAGIGTALLRMDKAIHDYNPSVSKDGRDKPLYNKLRSIRSDLEKLQLKYPLVIK